MPLMEGGSYSYISVICRLAALASPGSWLEMQNLRPVSCPLKQNLDSNKNHVIHEPTTVGQVLI